MPFGRIFTRIGRANALDWRFRVGEAMKRFAILLAASACLLGTASARAEAATFQFNSFFATGSVGMITMTGTFSGDLQGNRVSNISDVSLFRDGNAFRGNGKLFAFQYDRKKRTWNTGGYLSLDGSDNNIMFIDTDYESGDAGFYNYFYSVTGIGNVAFQPSYYRYLTPQTTQTTVWQTAVAQAGVPEPSAWALLVLGFGTLGAALRRRAGSVLRNRTA